MKIIAACLLLFMTVQSLYAQERLPIIDMHLHAMVAAACNVHTNAASGLGSQPALH